MEIIFHCSWISIWQDFGSVFFNNINHTETPSVLKYFGAVRNILRIMMKRLFLTILLAIASFHAHAWDGVVSGKIVRMESVGGAAASANFDLRVYLSSATPPCPGNSTVPVYWSYINANDYNYKGIMSMLLMAHAMDKEVTIHSNIVGGFCQIAWVIVA